LTVYALPEVIGRNCRFLQAEGSDNSQAQSEIRYAVENGRDTQVTLHNARTSGEPFANFHVMYSVNDTDGAPLFFLGSPFDLSVSTQAMMASDGGILDLGINRVLGEASRLRIRTKSLLAEQAFRAVQARLHEK